MLKRKKILIAVKTYPNLSYKHDELVCTAGVMEDGSWVRLYPIPFRQMDYDKQYKKYNWIEIDVAKQTEDMRPESFKPYNMGNLDIVGHLDTKNNWEERKKYLLKNVYDDMNRLISLAHSNQLSLAVFKPKKIIKLEHEAVPESKRQDYQNKMGAILNKRKQLKLIDDGLREIKPVLMPDYHFCYSFQDINDKERKMRIEDWEIQALYRKRLLHYKGDKSKAVEDVRKKYWDDFVFTKELYFFLGTTLEFHRRKALNPFTIVGIFYPKR